MRRRFTQLLTQSLTQLLFIGSLMTVPAFAASMDPEQLRSTCDNITPSQRQMAKAAGYDVDALCSSLGDLSNAKGQTPAESGRLVLPRDSAIITDERGVINQPESEKLDLETEENPVDNRSPYVIAAEKGQLKKFGYDLFSGVPTTFAPATDIPAPVDYAIGPGDTFAIQLLGKESKSLSLKVDRNGQIMFPQLGPVDLTGTTFDEARKIIQQRVKEQMIGVEAIVSLSELRSIRVFVLGEAFKPGSYTVSSLSTMTNALLVSGGITDIGSLRNIQLKRSGKVVASLDLYDLLLRGDTSGDERLLPGDVIYIPAVGDTVAVTGEVNRPAIYELKKDRSVGQLIKMAGGYTGKAYLKSSFIERVADNGFKTVIDLDLSQKAKLRFPLQEGDILTVDSVIDRIENSVTLEGHVYRKLNKKWHPKMRVSDLIQSIEQFKDNPALDVGLIIRKTQPLRKIRVLKFNIANVLRSPGSADDLQLAPLDKIVVLDSGVWNRTENEVKEELDDKKPQSLVDFLNDEKAQQEEAIKIRDRGTRENVLFPIVMQLLQQTNDGGLANVVSVDGNVQFPGIYPLAEGMDVKDLISLAGGLKEASYLGNAEVTRRDMSNAEEASILHINVNLRDELLDKSSFQLTAKDKVSVYTTPEYQASSTIELSGEVRFPGTYEFRRGETLSQVIARAGGFTSMAHIQAAVFTRKDLKTAEQKQLEKLKEQMRADIAASELEDAAAGKSSGVRDAEAILNALSETEALGRLVISLNDIMNGKAQDVQLKDGDKLFVPTYRQEVSVVGEVQHPTSHLYNEHWQLEDYLEHSGGISQRADEDRIYVVKADGSVFLPNQSGWLTHQNEMLSPGDTIVVPLDTDRIKSLTLWTQTSQIIYQLALGAAAITRL